MKNKSFCFYVVNISCILVLLFSMFFGYYNIKTNTVKEVIKITGDPDKEIENLSNDNTLHLTNEYATHYFYNLTENFGVNEMGSCGYVALGMLLGYYDTYWNDNIIAEGFDKNAVLQSNSFTTNVSSPGINAEHSLLDGITGNKSYQDGEDYLDRIVEQNFSNFFHLKLIEIGNNLGYYDASLGRKAAGLQDSELLDLTEHYLYNIKEFNENQVKIESRILLSNPANSSDYEVRLFVEEKVKQGIPVLISMAQIEGGAVEKKHAMIAYDYDFEEATNTNKIYVHTGLKNDDNHAVTHIDITSTNYSIFTSAIALQPRMAHGHTNNYKYTTSNNTTIYCPCAKIKENSDDPCDIPLYYRSTINFEHLNCLVNNAYVTNNNVYVQTPHEYIYDCRSSFSLDNMIAQVPNYGYEPYHKFLGWCLDDKLTTRATSISAGNRGEIVLYAKWRVDYGRLAGHGEQTITSAGVMSNASDQIFVGSVEELRQLQSMGITKLTISFHINMWEVKNGTQYVYLYGGSNGSDELASTTFNVTSSKEVKCVRFTVNISDLQETPCVYIRYNASKSGWWIFEQSHDWKHDEISVEISYVVNESDITGDNAADFVWRYENSLALKCSNCN